jgi:hypothetical protein
LTASRTAIQSTCGTVKIGSALVIILLLTAISSVSTLAGTSMSGFYELNYEQLQDNPGDSHGGNLGYIKHYFELRFYSNPTGWLETFHKVGANGEDVLHPDNFHCWENHIQFKRWGVEAVLFSNQWRHSFSEYLLGLISGEARGDFGRAQGLRLDLSERRGFRSELMISQNGEGDAVYIARLKQHLARHLDLGTTILQRDWSDPHIHPDSSFNRVIAGDLEISALDADLTLEYAESWDPSLEKEPKRRWIDGRVGNRSAFKVEARGLRLGAITELAPFREHLGAFLENPLVEMLESTSLLGHYRDYGKEFHDHLSDQFHPSDRGGSFDQTGYFLQAVIPVPRKAITLTLRHDGYRTSLDPEKYSFLEKDGHRRAYQVQWTQAELYIEFMGGITARANYEWYINHNPIREEFKLSERTESYFAEVQSENEIALVKFQVKKKDIGQKDRVFGGSRRFGDRTIVGTEVKANISEKWQVYSRMALVDARVDTWSTLMAHVGYFLSPRAEIFIEFGSGWHTDNDLVNDNDIADNIQKIDHKLFFVTKVSF